MYKMYEDVRKRMKETRAMFNRLSLDFQDEFFFDCPLYSTIDSYMFTKTRKKWFSWFEINRKYDNSRSAINSEYASLGFPLGITTLFFFFLPIA